MKIRFFHQYFHPDVSSVSQIISQVAFYLSRHGDDVSVVCSRNLYDGGPGNYLPVRENIDGVEVERVWGPSFGRHSLLSRLMDMASFSLLAVFQGLFSKGEDVAIFLTNPPLFAAFGAVLRRVKRDRFVYIVMDVYPDIAVK
ncbi:MAG: hypothetical protein IH588_10110, partial [Anaerolineales bacterium]|nr:hypothetical protein [Anaerolineales bacterium]